ncbi:MAG: nucleotidyltransferase domain-containing protein [Lachnospiraceae bacterium]|nr:nucleotidyltransferase domain-containing protein [Lachnospiraceae bacterium]
MNSFNNMWDFPVIEGVSFVNANRVHPLMQRRVDVLISALKKNDNIRKLVLFGSSLEFRCNSYSDIDLYIEKYDKDKKIGNFPELDCEVDVITDLPSDSRLYQEIDRTGLLLFER